MKRRMIVIAALLVLASGLSGCGDRAAEDVADSGEVPAVTAPAVSVAGYDAMAADGANESAALAALPDAFAAQKASGSLSDVDWEMFEGVEPLFVAYLVRVDLNGQVALFEVRADSIAHNIYGYQRAFDSGSIIWTPEAEAQSPSVAPQSPGESVAAGAVNAAMLDAFPEDQFAVSIHGYRFAYLAADTSPLVFEIAPDGALISVSR